MTWARCCLGIDVTGLSSEQPATLDPASGGEGQRAVSPYTPIPAYNGDHIPALGCDVFTLQAVLGHSTQEAVRIYAQMAEMKVERAHHKAYYTVLRLSCLIACPVTSLEFQDRSPRLEGNLKCYFAISNIFVK